MTNIETKFVNSIREEYTEKKETKIDELRALDKQVKRPAEIFAYTFGVIGSLVLGMGMCLAMKVIGNMMIPGILIGTFGIGMVSANYFIYKKMLSARKEKYREEIMTLTDSIANK